jgi:hypothetical protein
MYTRVPINHRYHSPSEHQLVLLPVVPVLQVCAHAPRVIIRALKFALDQQNSKAEVAEADKAIPRWENQFVEDSSSSGRCSNQFRNMENVDLDT